MNAIRHGVADVPQVGVGEAVLSAAHLTPQLLECSCWAAFQNLLHPSEGVLGRIKINSIGRRLSLPCARMPCRDEADQLLAFQSTRLHQGCKRTLCGRPHFFQSLFFEDFSKGI